MALVGQAATIAQFAGVDAYGLIKMIAEAAQTVRRNKRTCSQLAQRARMIGDLLHQLHAAQLMQQPETRNPVEQLEETLRRALLLVRSCQGRSYLYRCFMGARHTDELREVQSEITFYLQLFPLVSYVDTTLTWVRLLNQAAADPSCKEAPMDYKVPGSEAQLLVPVDQCKEISMAPSHDTILQVPKLACVLHHTTLLEGPLSSTQAKAVSLSSIRKKLVHLSENINHKSCHSASSRLVIFHSFHPQFSQ